MNLTNNLIKQCTCGNSTDFNDDIQNEIPVLICNSCGVIHQNLPGWDEDRLKKWYAKEYHVDVQEAIGHQSYRDRYNHDKKIAEIRLTAYNNIITPTMSGIDIGSSNSAFVHTCLEKNIQCIGVEPGENIGDDSVTVRNAIVDCTFSENQFDFVTMHDSLEHMINIDQVLSKINFFLKINGSLIVDIPDYFVPGGLHHWREVQHLWFWNKNQMINIFNTFGFEVENITYPIPGKIVFYTRKKKRIK